MRVEFKKTLLEHIKIERLWKITLVHILGFLLKKVVEMRAGQQRKSERKFFPCYGCFAANGYEWRSLHLVKSIPRRMGFIGAATSDRTYTYTTKEANAIS